ncbi:type IV pilus biogenesis protein PilM [Maridesulfovibrio sp. FT414]|uniref:type IV pilus biogenesis protein PilM n=1 Tax=Maridesulfovibrio sp. FT414 TaxID=2979469 RepID=UPI003D80210A
MKMLAILFTILGVMALVTAENSFSPQAIKAESVATNYGVYRNAVNKFATGNASIAAGEISESLLDLPSGWKAIRSWANRLDGGNLYVWGPVNSIEAEQIRELFLNSYAIGIKRDGALLNNHGTGVALPGFIPEGSIVSVITP